MEMTTSSRNYQVGILKLKSFPLCWLHVSGCVEYGNWSVIALAINPVLGRELLIR